MSTFILVFFLHSYRYPYFTAVEFNSLKACEAGAKAIKEAYPYSLDGKTDRLLHVCIAKE